MVHVHIRSKQEAGHGWCRGEEGDGKPNMKCLARRNIDLFKFL